jgi:hypothetical protein
LTREVVVTGAVVVVLREVDGAEVVEESELEVPGMVDVEPGVVEVDGTVLVDVAGMLVVVDAAA